MKHKLPITFIRIVLFFSLVLSSLDNFGQQNELNTSTQNDSVLFDVHADSIEFRILKQFYESTGGAKWKKKTNWLSGPKTSDNMAKWFGVIVRNGDVSEIHLKGNGLSGQIPESVYSLRGLIEFNVEENSSSESSTTSNLSSFNSESSLFETLSGESLTTENLVAPLTRGRGLPFWGIASTGLPFMKIDWRKSPIDKGPLPNSPNVKSGFPGVAIDDCGEIAFYVHHSGVDAANQLNIYYKTGALFTNSSTALSSANSNTEIQVVRVPGKTNEWYVIYSAYKLPCLSNPPASAYCPARVVYATIKLQNGVLSILEREHLIGDGYLQGKAVSKKIDQSENHYLYLVKRASTGLMINKCIIGAGGIILSSEQFPLMKMDLWFAGVAGSSVELSPDQKVLAITNRGVNIYVQIILFNLEEFKANPTTYAPELISALDHLEVEGTAKSIRQLSLSSSCLRFLGNKISFIEFSPSGQYLYAVHGGYPGGASAYKTYIIQIDLRSKKTPTSRYKVRMQVQAPGNGSTNCAVYKSGQNDNYLRSIQSAYDGRLYFTKASSSELFAIPNPDDPMPHSLVPGSINFDQTKNIPMGAIVEYMPEQIDGHRYLNNVTAETFTLTPQVIGMGDLLTLNTALSNYQIDWGDGSNVEDVTQSGNKTHTYTIPGDYTIYMTWFNGQCASVKEKTIRVIQCKEIQPFAISYTKILCATKFSIQRVEDCVTTYEWTFPNGAKSYDRTPLYSHSDLNSYQVSVRIKYLCEKCNDVIDRDIIVTSGAGTATLVTENISVPYEEKPEVIAASATTFAGTWGLDHSEPKLSNLHPFVSGAEGVWRPEGTYVYRTERSQSSTINLAKDGTYTLQTFNWPYAYLEPDENWLKANTIKKYNAYNFETENQDVLGTYSSALYDYDGQLQTAYGINMRQDEMAFTSFENENTSKITGNFAFNNELFPKFKSYEIISGWGHIAVVKAKIEEFDEVDVVDVAQKKSSFVFFSNFVYLTNNQIVCKQVYAGNPDWTVLVLKTAPDEEDWTGSIRKRNNVPPSAVGVISSTVAHSGKSSLHITQDKLFQQPLLNLEAGKSYHFSGWVTTNPLDSDPIRTPTFYLDKNIVVEVVLKNKQGKTISVSTFVPEGKIIEDWQSIRGSFSVPENDLIVSLKFSKGTEANVYFDDIRIFPETGNMKSYVYDATNFRLQSILDEENFASYFYYDAEGNLFLTKKETEEGIKTVTENVSQLKPTN